MECDECHKQCNRVTITLPVKRWKPKVCDECRDVRKKTDPNYGKPRGKHLNREAE